MKRPPAELPLEAKVRRDLAGAGWLAALSEHDGPVLVYVVAHILTRQRPPSQQEMAARFGWASRTSALNRVRSLAAAGFVAAAAGARPLKVLGLELVPVYDRKEPPHDAATVADRPRQPPARRAALPDRPAARRAGVAA